MLNFFDAKTFHTTAGDFAQLCRQHRHECDGCHVTAQQREANDRREFGEHDADHAFHEEHRQEDDQCRQRGGQNRRRHFARPFVRRFKISKMLLVSYSVDVLQHDDGVVNQHADAERQTA